MLLEKLHHETIVFEWHGISDMHSAFPLSCILLKSRLGKSIFQIIIARSGRFILFRMNYPVVHTVPLYWCTMLCGYFSLMSMYERGVSTISSTNKVSQWIYLLHLYLRYIWKQTKLNFYNSIDHNNISPRNPHYDEKQSNMEVKD